MLADDKLQKSDPCTHLLLVGIRRAVGAAVFGKARLGQPPACCAPTYVGIMIGPRWRV
jgi:hypothetical protein